MPRRVVAAYWKVGGLDGDDEGHYWIVISRVEGSLVTVWTMPEVDSFSYFFGSRFFEGGVGSSWPGKESFCSSSMVMDSFFSAWLEFGVVLRYFYQVFAGMRTVVQRVSCELEFTGGVGDASGGFLSSHLP